MVTWCAEATASAQPSRRHCQWRRGSRGLCPQAAPTLAVPALRSAAGGEGPFATQRAPSARARAGPGRALTRMGGRNCHGTSGTVTETGPGGSGRLFDSDSEPTRRADTEAG